MRTTGFANHREEVFAAPGNYRPTFHMLIRANRSRIGDSYWKVAKIGETGIPGGPSPATTTSCEVAKIRLRVKLIFRFVTSGSRTG